MITEEIIEGDDEYFYKIIKEKLEYEMTRMIYIVIIIEMFEDIIDEHRILWGTNMDNEPINVRS